MVNLSGKELKCWAFCNIDARTERFFLCPLRYVKSNLSSYLGHASLSLETSPHGVINTLGFPP